MPSAWTTFDGDEPKATGRNLEDRAIRLGGVEVNDVYGGWPWGNMAGRANRSPGAGPISHLARLLKRCFVLNDPMLSSARILQWSRPILRNASLAPNIEFNSARQEGL